MENFDIKQSKEKVKDLYRKGQMKETLRVLEEETLK